MKQIRSFRIGVAVCAVALGLAACQSKDPAAALAVDGAAADPQKITTEELQAFCPRVQLREGTATFRTYAKGGQDDPAKLAYQASISDVTRACTYSGGAITMNVAVAGRVVTGPAGGSGSVTLPIRVAVLNGDQVVYSQMHQHQVAASSGTTQFIFNDPAVTIPAGFEKVVQIYAGFDEGPAKPKPKTADADE
jgi:hypothetical protein